ncbi:hypothetical protein DN585_12020 [Intrasporangium calvum]|nr:hypothetical protein DN585_12020 [Intrasporangium calvum]
MPDSAAPPPHPPQPRNPPSPQPPSPQPPEPPRPQPPEPPQHTRLPSAGVGSRRQVQSTSGCVAPGRQLVGRKEPAVPSALTHLTSATTPPCWPSPPVFSSAAKAVAPIASSCWW